MERKKAIEIIKKNWPDSKFTMLREALETLIPELKESEDERICAEIRDFISWANDRGCITKEQREKTASWFSWLEDEGEHAKFRNSIQVGDKVTRNEDGVLVNLTHLKRVANKGIEKAIKEKKGEQKQTVIIPRFRVGDVITSTKNSALKYKIKAVGVLNELGEYDYVVEDVTDTDYKGRIHEMSISKVDEWGVVVEQKPAWSEEDEKMFLDIESLIHSYRAGSYEYELSSWFKSLRPQSTWKPSDEQIEFLSDAIKHYNSLGYPVFKLKELLKDLEKLKG